MPLMTSEHIPQMPSRQSESNAIGSCPRSRIPSFTTSSISRNDMSSSTPLASYASNRPGACPFFCRQTFRVKFMAKAFSRSLIAAGAHVHFLVHQRFLVHDRSLVGTLILPSGLIREILVIALRLAVWCLKFLPEVPSTGFAAMQRVQAQ